MQVKRSSKHQRVQSNQHGVFAGDGAPAVPHLSPSDALDHAVHALDRLEQLLARPRVDIHLDESDGPWLTRLGVTGMEALVGTALPRSTVEVLRNSVVVAQTAQTQGPVDTAKLYVHAPDIRPFLQSRYSLHHLQRLVGWCREHGVFDMKVDKDTGLVRTSDTDENWEMGSRYWVTDTVRCGALTRTFMPEAWKCAMGTLLSLYSQPREQDIMARVIADPRVYRLGTSQDGVAHVFVLGENKVPQRDDKWFNNKRLESHGLALAALCNSITAGVVHGKPWGITAQELQGARHAHLGKVVGNLAAYLIALDYPTAPSAGPWEEVPLEGGLTWDVEAVRYGLEQLDDLLFNDAHEQVPGMAGIRKDVLQHGSGLLDQDRLAQRIAAGHQRIQERLLGGATPVEHPDRPWDASTCFIAGSTVSLAEDPCTDVTAHFHVLDCVAARLVRDHGMIRYAPFTVRLKDGSTHTSPDSYLSKNYWTALNGEGRLDLDRYHRIKEFGSKDASDLDVFLARARLSTSDTEAQWFMVSDISTGYGNQVAKLLRCMEAEGRKPTQAELVLIHRGMDQETLYLNRAFARITGGATACKSNGAGCPSHAVPEAYECVSTWSGEERYLPGANTPLAWAAASLFQAAGVLQSNLEACERMGITQD